MFSGSNKGGPCGHLHTLPGRRVDTAHTCTTGQCTLVHCWTVNTRALLDNVQVCFIHFHPSTLDVYSIGNNAMIRGENTHKYAYAIKQS